MRKKILWCIFCAGLIPMVMLPRLAAAKAFHELKRFKLGGEGGWDLLAVGEGGKFLYIARSNRVMVVEASSGKLAGEIAGIEGAHGVALVPKLHLGFATAGRLGEVWAFELESLKVVAKIKVGENPDAILFDTFSNHVFAFNAKSHTISAIDPAEKKVVGTVALDGAPELGASDEAGNLFLNLEDKSSVAVIDTKKLQVIRSIALSPCEEPTGIAIDPATVRLFVGCKNSMAAVVDGRSGKVLQTAVAGKGIDGAAFDAGRKLAFFPAGEGKLTIMRETENGFELSQEVKTQKGSRTIAVDSTKGIAYLPAAEFGPPVPGAGPKGVGRPPILPGSFAVLVIGQ